MQGARCAWAKNQFIRPGVPENLQADCPLEDFPSEALKTHTKHAKNMLSFM